MGEHVDGERSRHAPVQEVDQPASRASGTTAWSTRRSRRGRSARPRTDSARTPTARRPSTRCRPPASATSSGRTTPSGTTPRRAAPPTTTDHPTGHAIDRPIGPMGARSGSSARRPAGGPWAGGRADGTGRRGGPVTRGRRRCRQAFGQVGEAVGEAPAALSSGAVSRRMAALTRCCTVSRSSSEPSGTASVSWARAVSSPRPGRGPGS